MELTLSAKIVGVTNFWTKTGLKFGTVQKFVMPKNFLTDIHMCSVNSMTTTGMETRNMKANLNHGMKDCCKHAKL